MQHFEQCPKVCMHLSFAIAFHTNGTHYFVCLFRWFIGKLLLGRWFDEFSASCIFNFHFIDISNWMFCVAWSKFSSFLFFFILDFFRAIAILVRCTTDFFVRCIKFLVFVPLQAIFVCKFFMQEKRWNLHGKLTNWDKKREIKGNYEVYKGKFDEKSVLLCVVENFFERRFTGQLNYKIMINYSSKDGEIMRNNALVHQWIMILNSNPENDLKSYNSAWSFWEDSNWGFLVQVS